MKETTYDAVIVGAGHNGLVCGTYLARSGLSVCVIEKQNIIGGAAVSEAVWPGYRVSVASYVMNLLQPRIIEDLQLARHGFSVIQPTPMLHLYGKGKFLVLAEDAKQMARNIAPFSMFDAAAYPNYDSYMVDIGKIITKMLWEIPPDPGDTRITERLRVLKFMWRYRNLGDRFYDLYDILTLSAEEWLKRWFESDEVITALAFYVACSGAATTPSSPGSAYVLLRSYIRDNTTRAGPSGIVQGGMGAVSAAIASSGQRYGMEIRTGAPVKRVVVRNGRAQGVELENGQTVHAKYVISNAASKVLFRDLVDSTELPASFINRIERIRDRSTAFKVNLALNRLPSFADFDPVEAGCDYPMRLRIGASMDYLERAFDAAKGGRISEAPALVVVIPSVLDSTVAPAGKHLITIFGHHAPYDLCGASWAESRQRLYEVVLNTLAQHAPDIRECIDAAQTLSPYDLEQRFSLPGGHIHHGELSADQMFFRRPTYGIADYRTPIKGLYQCGASVHPGGGVTGVPGYNASRVVLKDQR